MHNGHSYLLINPTLWEFERVHLVQINLRNADKLTLIRDNWLLLSEEQVKSIISTPKS